MMVVQYTGYNLLLGCGAGPPGVGLTDWWGWGFGVTTGGWLHCGFLQHWSAGSTPMVQYGGTLGY